MRAHVFMHVLESIDKSDAICRSQRALGSPRLPKQYLVPLPLLRPNVRWRQPGDFQTLNHTP